MLTDELDKQKINKMIERARNSVNISFAQMLAYIDNITETIPEGDIKTLLGTYRAMADKFYTQYENSLLEKIKSQSDAQKQTNQVIDYIKKLPDTPEKRDLINAIPLLEKAHYDAVNEYNNLTSTFPTLLQNALDKLKDEWQRLNTIAVASQTLTEDEDLIQALEAVVTVAGFSVGIEVERIAVVPGNAFALYFFTYLENFAVLTVPIYSVRAPWEWSIFWHELAGYKVRQLKMDTTIDSVRTSLLNFHDLYKGMKTDKEKNDLLDKVTWNNVYNTDNPKQEKDTMGADLQKRKNRYGKKYLAGFFSQNELDFEDLGSFEHQFEQLLENLLKKGEFQAYDQIKAVGWCVDWFEELFEDAWSVMAIREPFLDFFKDILNRHQGTDGRHPTPDVRLKVAGEILRLMNSEGEIKPPKSVEESAAQQILKFMSLLAAASYQSGILEDDSPEMRIAFDMRRGFRTILSESVGIRIGNSISHWSSEYLESSNRVREAKEGAKNLIDELSDQELSNFISGLASTTDERYQLDPTYYEKLLDGRNYKRLLEFSFFEVDYHTPGDIQLLESGRSYWVKPTDWNSVIWLTQRRAMGSGKLPTETVVREVGTGVDWKVKIADWDGWFKMTQ